MLSLGRNRCSRSPDNERASDLAYSFIELIAHIELGQYEFQCPVFLVVYIDDFQTSRNLVTDTDRTQTIVVLLAMQYPGYIDLQQIDDAVGIRIIHFHSGGKG